MPDFFPLDGKWVLTLEPMVEAGSDATIYFVGDYDGRRFTPQRSGLLDSGWLYRAAESFWAADGRRIVFAWLFEGRNLAARNGAGWSGTASVPCELSLGPDGRLRIAPIRELAVLRGEHCHVEKLRLAPAGGAWVYPLGGDQLEIAVEVRRGEASAVRLHVLSSPDQRETTVIRYDWVAGRLSLDTTWSSLNRKDEHESSVQIAGVGTDGMLAAALTEPPFSLGDDEPLQLRVYVDRSIVEVFANERAAMTSRVYPTRRDSTLVTVAAEGGPCDLVATDVWKMGSIWQ